MVSLNVVGTIVRGWTPSFPDLIRHRLVESIQVSGVFKMPIAQSGP